MIDFILYCVSVSREKCGDNVAEIELPHMNDSLSNCRKRLLVLHLKSMILCSLKDTMRKCYAWLDNQ